MLLLQSFFFFFNDNMGEKFGQNYAKKFVPLSLFYKELYSFFYGTLIFTDFKYHKIQFVPQNSFIPMLHN
jgi:uncharacterized PurR-regulated membrane protein YhhQ (DUF165 family)